MRMESGVNRDEQRVTPAVASELSDVGVYELRAQLGTAHVLDGSFIVCNDLLHILSKPLTCKGERREART